jgi:predicted RNA methylase
MKIKDDKYYTPPDLARELIVKTLRFIGAKNVTDIVEPSAGNGSFSKWFKNCRAYDIEPEAEGIIKQDFLTLNLPYQKGRLIIENPPFGNSNHLSRKFYKKATELGDYIAFIQPISQYKNNLQMYLFDLVYSEDLGVVKYSDRELHCCFNIYKRPENGILNERPDYTLKDITIIEHRRKKGDYQTAKNKDISPDYDYAMCNWGDGSLGRPCKYIGQYAQEVYFYCHKKEFLPKMLELLEFNTVREYVKSISMKRISVMRLYKYLRDNIEGIR